MSKLILIKDCIETFIRWMIIRYKNGVNIFELILDILMMPIMFIIFALIVVFKNKWMINSKYYAWAEQVVDCVWG